VLPVLPRGYFFGFLAAGFLVLTVLAAVDGFEADLLAVFEAAFSFGFSIAVQRKAGASNPSSNFLKMKSVIESTIHL